ncbi:hypothetical protein K504DRAFT_457839 [Pleomassaria siparia CBS 279.74]|uniref:Uncharacterized protein n=1 Tax=Pleomassaria siparia CBS 279.74 TaxID=1314801 RepID=A0A6G1KTH4_9PLEO|nr:hypothetical protein K504DRAFT_457839 [Pleomassaria siparia CBS 279.74]
MTTPWAGALLTCRSTIASPASPNDNILTASLFGLIIYQHGSDNALHCTALHCTASHTYKPLTTQDIRQHLTHPRPSVSLALSKVTGPRYLTATTISLSPKYRGCVVSMQ